MALPDYPISRIEQYLARWAGEDVPIPDFPITRVERYLAAIGDKPAEPSDSPLVGTGTVDMMIVGEENAA